MAPAKQKAALTSFLIDEVQGHPAIWNKTVKDYKNVIVKSNAWSSILMNLENSFDADELSRNQLQTIKNLKNHWRNLRDTYGKKKNESKGKSGAGLEDVQSKRDWPFYSSMQFLDQVFSWCTQRFCCLIVYLLSNSVRVHSNNT